MVTNFIRIVTMVSFRYTIDTPWTPGILKASSEKRNKRRDDFLAAFGDKRDAACARFAVASASAAEGLADFFRACARFVADFRPDGKENIFLENPRETVISIFSRLLKTLPFPPRNRATSLDRGEHTLWCRKWPWIWWRDGAL